MLKYEGVFKVGDTIRALYFEPRDGVPDRFIEGVVTDTRVVPEMGGANVYVIDVTRDSVAEASEKVTSRVNDEGYVPMGLAWFEFDGRVVLSERGEEERLSRTEAAEDAMDDFNYRGSRHHY